ncbi:MAG: UvrD-helicase domain-containing protein [Planctomycetaceae bacterium]|jgi:ATP-dependent exoDNAse (exonuclease V) beta subunit|nr:UvrD-helicase domain-containing protein [Planctomycetaceae bacterium]
MTNTVIQASAGSGKTHQLSDYFLAILFADAGVEIDSILASTFTRKAAGEITDRILKRLAAAVINVEPKEKKERNNIINILKNTNDNINPNANKIDDQNVDDVLFKNLARLVRELYKVRICTLDAFFNKIASTIFLELGFPADWSVADETFFGKAIKESVHNVLSNSNRNFARQLMNNMQQGDQNRSITRDIYELAQITMPLVRESPPSAWYREDLLKKESEPETVDHNIQLLLNAELPQKQTANFEKARTKIATYANQNQWKDFLKSTFIKNIINKTEKFGRVQIEGELLEAAKELINHAKAVQLNKLVGQTKATRDFFELVIEEYDKISTREQVLQFTDITERLGTFVKQIFKNNDTNSNQFFESILYRMNVSVDHMLLDEFQDTSKPQWDILEPFAMRVVNDAGSTFLCVGDVKQAIYAWRGGVADIFNSINNSIPNLQIKHLNKSYRSSKIILETVNKLFFENIKYNDALEKYRDAAIAWSTRMQRHVAEFDLDGYCRLEIAPESVNNNDEEQTTENDNSDSDNDDNRSDVENDSDNTHDNSNYAGYVVEKVIMELHKKRGDCSIGILVPKNRYVGALMKELKQRNINASEEGGNALTDSAAVQCILSAMKFADHPADLVSRFHLANCPLAEEIGFRDKNDYKSNARAAGLALKIRQKIITDGYDKVIARYVELLAPSCNKREFQKLEKLLELAYRFQEDVHGVRTERFIATINAAKVETPNAADKIQVMTIHKSKGMEFDVVVLPYLNEKLARNDNKLVVGRKDAVSDIDFVIRYVDQSMQMLLPEKYQEAFQKRLQGEIEESLSLLYVAMTRAKHELVMIIEPPKKKKNDQKNKKTDSPAKQSFPATFAGILMAGLTNNNETFDKNNDSESLVLFESGNPNWSKDTKDKSIIETKIAKTIRTKESLFDEDNEVGDEAESGADDVVHEVDRVVDDVEAEQMMEVCCELSDRKVYRFVSRVTPSAHKTGGRANYRNEKDVNEYSEEVFEHELPMQRQPNESSESRLNRDAAKLWGTAIHACFEHVLDKSEWLDVNKIDRDSLRVVIDKILLTQAANKRKILKNDGATAVVIDGVRIDADLVMASFIDVCCKPEICEVLSRARYEADEIEVLHERRFWVFLSERELMKGSIDRLVIERDKGQIIKMEVIDFKTDRLENGVDEESFLAERKKIHAAQMESYRKGMAKLYNITPDKINTTLVFTNIGKFTSIKETPAIH